MTLAEIRRAAWDFYRYPKDRKPSVYMQDWFADGADPGDAVDDDTKALAGLLLKCAKAGFTEGA